MVTFNGFKNYYCNYCSFGDPPIWPFFPCSNSKSLAFGGNCLKLKDVEQYIHPPNNQKHFAFLVPSLNNRGPILQLTVLPQVMANLPHCVNILFMWSYAPLIKKFPHAYIVHYTDVLWRELSNVWWIYHYLLANRWLKNNHKTFRLCPPILIFGLHFGMHPSASPENLYQKK